jgi:ribosome recycling factor
MTVQDILNATETKMKKALDHFEEELRGIRTGRASSALVENIKADYYGNPTPLKQLGTISCPEPRLIVIKPFDVSCLPAIEKAIMASDLGITPLSDGKLIRLNVPTLTEDRRKQLVGMVKKMLEAEKMIVRNVRRDSNKEIETIEKKDKLISEDEATRAKDQVQKKTAAYEAKLDAALDKKSKEIMEL